MFHVVLVHPEIPPNTGNIMRLCANTGCHLHLIEPLGFDLSEKQLRRAGMDYRDLANVSQWPDFDTFLTKQQPNRCITLSTQHQIPYSDFQFQPQDALIFGSEGKGLPDDVRAIANGDSRLTIPMRANNRSLNLSNSVAIVVYEAWRQHQFK